jgi:heptosyltransferase-3
MSAVKNLLIYRFGQIGDTIAALPSLWLLRGSFQSAHFTLLSEVPQHGNHLPPEQILPPQGLVQHYIKYRAGSSLWHLLSMLSTVMSLRRMKFDAVAYLLPSIRSPRQRVRDAWFFRLAGIKQTIGFEGYPDDPFPRSADGTLAPVMHEADALLKRLAASGLPAVNPGEGCMDMGITACEQARADAWWATQKGPSLAPHGWFAVCAGSKWSSKQWPAERYYEVGKKLIEEHGLLPIIFGGNEDRELGHKLIARWGTGLCAAGDLSVRESAALLRGAAFYLGNDTGVMHLAAAVGTPCVGIFSSIDWPGRWFPYGQGHQVIRNEVPCAGCMSAFCSQHILCLTSIEVGRVLSACQKVLIKTRKH